MIGSIRKLLGPCLVLAALLTPLAAGAETVRITFLHTNDFYEMAPIEGIGGFAPLMTLLKRERAAAEHSVTTFGGDLISPSLMSGVTRGAHMIELMNAVGLDVAVIGNHEFDFGPDVAARRIAESRFTWLGSNVTGPDGEPPLGLAGTLMRRAGGLNIGFLGLIFPGTAQASSPGPDVRFHGVMETARRTVAALRRDGADIVVALTHLELADDKRLAREVSGIDLILAGHDHIALTTIENGVPIHQAGADAHYLGVVELAVETGGETLTVTPSWRLATTRDVPPDASIAQIVDRYAARMDAELNRPIATTTVALDTRHQIVRTREAAFGNLVAEAMRVATGADAALTNGGGIRGNRIYAPGTTLTAKAIMRELPFGNLVVMLELTGTELRQALEHAVSGPAGENGGFLHIAGMRVAYDPARPSGDRVTTLNVGGNPVDNSQSYWITTNDYLAKGGNGYDMFKQAARLIDPSAAQLMTTVVIDYIRKTGTVTQTVDGRVSSR